MSSNQSPRLSVVRCHLALEYGAEIPALPPTTILTLLVDGQREQVGAEGATGYETLHIAVAKAVEKIVGVRIPCPVYPADESLGRMLSHVCAYFEKELEQKMSHPSPRRPIHHPCKPDAATGILANLSNLGT